jgi:hypothetical protein
MTWLWNYVIYKFIPVEMKWLKCIEKKLAHVLVQVSLQNSSVEVIYDSSTVYHLQTEIRPAYSNTWSTKQ